LSLKIRKPCPDRMAFFQMIEIVERFYGDPIFTRFRRSMSLTEVRRLD